MIDTSLFGIMDFFIDQGQFTQADKQRLQTSGFVDDEIINRILNN
jgi:hypothetical protein